MTQRANYRWKELLNWVDDGSQSTSEEYMEWREINCIIEALEALLEKYEAQLADENLDEDTRADVSNDHGYAKILLSNYYSQRDTMLLSDKT
jgi:hypothetical protein